MPPPRRSPPGDRTRGVAPRPLSDAEIDRLQALLDQVPPPLEPLDVAMVDGFLCGVLLQPGPVPADAWLRHVTDVDGRALPSTLDATALHALVVRRRDELDAAIEARRWFDPWVFELEADEAAAAPPSDGDAEEDPAPVDAVYPWVAGFAAALEVFPGLMALDAAALLEPLALLYRHLDPEDLEDADALLAEIETLEPPRDLAEAVEELVRATLLLADVSRPRRTTDRPRRR